MIKTAISYVSDIVMGKRTAGQIWNLVKFHCSSKKEVLSYDPLTFSICTTDNCNLQCNMCLTHSAKFSNADNRHVACQDISLELFKKAIDRYKNATTVLLIGTGEPVLNKDFFEMIEYSSKKKMDSFTVSNGTIVGKYIDRILSSSLTEISISINGHNAEEFHRLTGEKKEYYNTICENISTLVRKRDELKSPLKISISMIIDKINYKELQKMIDKAGELGVDTANYLNFLPVFENEEFSPDKRCLFEDDRDVVKAFERLVIPDRPQVNLQPLLRREVKERICKVFFTTLRVDGDGNVGSCGRMLLKMKGNGNILDKDPWNNEYFQSMRRKYINYEESLPDACLVCTNNAGDSNC